MSAPAVALAAQLARHWSPAAREIHPRRSHAWIFDVRSHHVAAGCRACAEQHQKVEKEGLPLVERGGAAEVELQQRVGPTARLERTDDSFNISVPELIRP